MLRGATLALAAAVFLGCVPQEMYIALCAQASRSGHRAIAAVRINGDKEPFGWIFRDDRTAFFRFAMHSGGVSRSSKTLPHNGEQLGTFLHDRKFVPDRGATDPYSEWWYAEQRNAQKPISIAPCPSALQRSP